MAVTSAGPYANHLHIAPTVNHAKQHVLFDFYTERQKINTALQNLNMKAQLVMKINLRQAALAIVLEMRSGIILFPKKAL